MSIMTPGGIFGLDYKVGEWTAGISDGTNVSSTTQTGKYVKVGQLVQVSFTGFNNIDTTGLTGSLGIRVTGLPFVVDSSFLGGSVVFDTVDTGSAVLITPVPIANGTDIVFRTTISGATDNRINVQDFTSGTSDIGWLSVTYLTK